MLIRILCASVMLSGTYVSARTTYSFDVVSHASEPVLSKSNAVGSGHSDCIVFNPSIVSKSAGFDREGLMVRECCGSQCVGHGRRLLGEVADRAERISFAQCDLLSGVCDDPEPSFNLDPTVDTEDPRVVLYNDTYYNFYYRGTNQDPTCAGSQCTVQLSRTRTPLNASSWQFVKTLPWHRNGCCHVRPKGQRTYCMWGEGPGPFPGLGISYTTDMDEGNFTQVPWQNSGDAATNATSPLTADSMWMLPFGADRDEVKLEAGTHMHELSTGDVVTFYAAATPGWVPNGNYTVGWLVLSGANPTEIVQRSQTHVLIPTWDYETLCNGDAGCKYVGERKNVIFASSAMPTRTKDQFRLYFGGGDGNVGTAVFQILTHAQA